jgi:hypothetical protein
MGHPVGGLTGGEETRVLSIYTFISSNPSAISLAKEHTYKTKERVTRTPLKTGVNSGAPEG